MSPQRTTVPTAAGVIAQKITPPPIPERMVERNRLDEQIGASLAEHRVLVVTAAAGAGKTTAVLTACAGTTRPTAWLSVDRSDQAPGRLLTYLEAAISRVVPRLEGTVARALAEGIPHPEATGLLVEAIGDRPVIVSLDDLERLEKAPAAWAVIEALVRYMPPTVTAVLLSRADVPVDVCELPLPSDTAVLDETELAFTEDEARAALTSASGEDVTSAELNEVLRVTGGWVAGVLYRAGSQGGERSGRAGSPARYLSTRVLAQLDRRDRDFLVHTALLDEVDADSAAALGIDDAPVRLESLRSAHLPASWTADGRSLRCHSLLRDHLLELLHREDPTRLRAMELASVGVLIDRGHDEEAVEILLHNSAYERALAPARGSIVRVVERLDFAVAERWLDALRSVAPIEADELHLAELLLAVGRSDFARGAAVGDRLAKAGERDRFVAGSDQAAGLLAFCYGEVGRLADLQQVVIHAGDGPGVNVIRYSERLTSGDCSSPRPAPTGGPLDVLLLAVDYGLGRFQEMALPTSRWTTAVHTPERIAALRALGRTEEALALYAEARESGVIDAGFSASVVAELFIDLGMREQAIEALAEGRACLDRGGSRYRVLLCSVVAARLALHLDRDPDSALLILEEVEDALLSFPVLFIREVCQTWKGMALLLADRVDEATATLRSAVQSMVAGDRLLALPTAAVYLAEAEWRAHEEESADRAADLALAAARRQGSDHILLQALADFPAVVSRQIDAEADPNSPWHALGRVLLARGAALEVPLGVVVELRDLGAPRLLVSGVPRHPRIQKTYELLAYLATRPDRRATRDELLDALFGGSDSRSTRAYLRQAVSQLTRVLGEAGEVTVHDGVVTLSPHVSVSTTSGQFELRLMEASEQRGSARLEATLAALKLIEAGEYLERCSGQWIESRRRALTELATSAKSDAARLAFELGEYLRALRLTEKLLAEDPLLEDSWRLQMEIKAALGDYAGVLTSFQDCGRALARIEVTPAPSTRQLLERLRR